MGVDEKDLSMGAAVVWGNNKKIRIKSPDLMHLDAVRKPALLCNKLNKTMQSEEFCCFHTFESSLGSSVHTVKSSAKTDSEDSFAIQ